MKKLFLAAALLLCCSLLNFANAQVQISAGVNIGLQPAWGPVGYDHADYYYMPDIDAYYDVPAHQYVYFNNNVWIHSGGLPPRYSNYDVYHGYKVVVNQPTPWIHHDEMRARYAGYRGRHDQAIIRDSHDNRYRNHWNGGGVHGNYGHAPYRHGSYGHGNYGHGNRGGHGNYGHGNRGGHDRDRR